MNKDRWEALMLTMGLEPSIDSFNALYAAYSEKNRFYHTVRHISAMLSHLDNVTELADRPAELELAIWFHDAIYKALSKSNELDSAIWSQEFLVSKGYDEAGVSRVYNLIMATLHDREVKENDEKLIVDIDLTILGAPDEIYDEFERNVRQEYKMVPAFIYRKKRKEVLKSFLNSDSIYYSDFFKNKYERAARKNIARVIKVLWYPLP